MARRRNHYKKSKTRKDQTFTALFVVSCVISFFISIIVGAASRSGGAGFNVGSFFITLVIALPIMLVANFILSLPSVRGKLGERRVSKKLKRLAKKFGGYVINDVIIPGDNGKTSQIDHIYISPYGVFVVETKNYSGRIYGSENDQHWTQVLAYGHTKNKLYNPIKQNATHIYRLKELIGKNVNYVSIVVFVNGNITYVKSSNVYTLRELKHIVRKGDREVTPASDVDEINSVIMKYKENPVATNREHVKEIKQMKRDIELNICPRCGGNLVLRLSKNNKQFWGCENYPNCNFIKK